jgi:molybdopterin molybdotransferase
MLSFDEALSALLGHAFVLEKPVETVATMDCLGRVLAEPIVSTINVPPMDNSQMDGYAIRSSELSLLQSSGLPVSQRIPAGAVPQPLLQNSVARIFTGAMLPKGADAIVMQEQAHAFDQEGSPAIKLDSSVNPKSGTWVRYAGEDIVQGGTVLNIGHLLESQALGLAASVGTASLKVFPKVKVACFFTGDELAMPGEVLKPGAIYNSNRFTLVNMLKELGCEVTDFGIVADTLDATRAALRTAAVGHDLILTSGGVSVGEEDHVKPAVQAEGGIDMWQIAIKPGKPLAYGFVNRSVIEGSKVHDSKAHGSKAHFIGLPGNPVSSFVTFLLFVQPFIKRLQGIADWHWQARPMVANFDWPKADKRREFLRVRVNAQGQLDLFSNQSSGVLTSTVWATGLVDNPAGKTIATGDVVQYLAMKV